MASPAPAPWPDSLTGTPAINVIERAIERRRLANSLLLHGENLGTLANVAHGIADRLLNAESFAVGAGLSRNEPGQESPRKAAPTTETTPQYFPPKHHPDFFALRPAGKARQISANATRELIGRIQRSPQISHRKVAVIYEADRMHPSAANIFLKTLEEPPANTTILLLTTRPYSLLATIRSRCLHFRFTDSGYEALAEADEATRDRWKSTLSNYATWLEQLTAGALDKRAVATQVMGVYGLITRFNAVLDAATTQGWANQKEKLPDDLEDEEIDAIQTGITNGIRMKLFAEIERATAEFGRRQLAVGDATSRPVSAAITQLEHVVGLLRVNLNEATALENFLLSSLRIWAKS